VNTAGTSVKISHSVAPTAAARAAADASDPPRPSVVTSPSGDMPWKPVTSTIEPRSSRIYRTGDFSSTSFRMSRIDIGARNFMGNNKRGGHEIAS
jgi:hypothetical protein